MTPEQHQRLVRVEEDVRLLRQDINRFKGFISGMVFVITGLWAVVVIIVRSQT